MKTKLVKKFTKHVLFICIAGLISCAPQGERFYSEAYSEIENGNFRVAIDLLEKSASIEKSDKKRTKALAEAARIARFEIQDFDRAIRLNRQIVLKSEDAAQRLSAQENLAEIYLENTQNYSQALSELLILEQLIQNPEKKDKIKLKIAKSQFLSGNSKTTLEYIDSAIKTSSTEKKNFLKLKAQALVSLKRFDDSLLTYEELRKMDENFFANENLYIATSIVYEEKEDFSTALSYLEKYKEQIKDKTYLELRTKRLNERLTNKPLYNGRRK